jgi:hypothetical protein
MIQFPEQVATFGSMKYLTLMISRNISRTNRIDIDPPLGFEFRRFVIRDFFAPAFILINARQGQI